MKITKDTRLVVKSADGRVYGRIDGDEYVRDAKAQPLFRIDGDAAYDMNIPTTLLGIVDNGRITQPGTNKVLFTIHGE